MPKKSKSKKPVLKGIGGWLILILLGLAIMPFFYIYDTITVIPAILEGNISAFIMFFLSGFAAFLSIYCLKLMYKEKKEFPKWGIFNLWYRFAFTLIILFALSDTKGTPSDVLLELIAPVIWTAYFKKSKRVKNTFVK